MRAAHPDQWLVIEALDAHAENDHRICDRIAVIDVCADGRTTMKRYGELRRQHPHREFCFVHTSMVELNADLAADAGIHLAPNEIGEMDYGFEIGGILGMDSCVLHVRSSISAASRSSLRSLRDLVRSYPL